MLSPITVELNKKARDVRNTTVRHTMVLTQYCIDGSHAPENKGAIRWSHDWMKKNYIISCKSLPKSSIDLKLGVKLNSNMSWVARNL